MRATTAEKRAALEDVYDALSTHTGTALRAALRVKVTARTASGMEEARPC